MKDTLYMAIKEYRLAWMKLLRSAGFYKFYKNPIVTIIFGLLEIVFLLFTLYTLIFKIC